MFQVCTMKLRYYGMENTAGFAANKKNKANSYNIIGNIYNIMNMSYRQLPCDGRNLTPTPTHETGLQEKLGTSPCQLVFNLRNFWSINSTLTLQNMGLAGGFNPFEKY